MQNTSRRSIGSAAHPQCHLLARNGPSDSCGAALHAASPQSIRQLVKGYFKKRVHPNWPAQFGATGQLSLCSRLWRGLHLSFAKRRFLMSLIQGPARTERRTIWPGHHDACHPPTATIRHKDVRIFLRSDLAQGHFRTSCLRGFGIDSLEEVARPILYAERRRYLRVRHDQAGSQGDTKAKVTPAVFARIAEAIGRPQPPSSISP